MILTKTCQSTDWKLYMIRKSPMRKGNKFKLKYNLGSSKEVLTYAQGFGVSQCQMQEPCGFIAAVNLDVLS